MPPVKVKPEKVKGMRVKKGDVVQIITGKDRGKQGRVLAARPAERRVIVENLNVVKRHMKPKPMQNRSQMGAAAMTPGGVVEKAAPIPISNVMLVCPTCKRATRVGMHVKEVKGQAHRVRYCKRADCGQDIDD
jgi:large subunit ribosomal protein L24